MKALTFRQFRHDGSFGLTKSSLVEDQAAAYRFYLHTLRDALYEQIADLEAECRELQELENVLYESSETW